MNNSIYNIEKSHFKNIHSSFDNLLNSIIKINRDFTKEELEDIVLLNNDIFQLQSKINNLEIKLLKKSPKKKINKNTCNRLKNNDHANEVISKFLPYMMMYSMINK